jgi:vancomycin resistance protein YoaR
LAEPPPTRIHDDAEALPAPEPPARRTRVAHPARWITIGAGCAVGLVVWLYAYTVTAPRTIPGLRVARASIGATALEGLDLRVDDVTRAYLEQPVRFRLRGDVLPAMRREVGFLVDRESLKQALATLGRTGNPIADLRVRALARHGRYDVPVVASIDRSRALEFLSDLKDRLDRPAQGAKLDLEHHTTMPEQAGYLVQVYQSLVNIEYAAQSGQDVIELAAVVSEPKVTQKDLAGLDVSTVMGSWQTAYSMAAVDSDRTYNLKVGASKVDGTVIQPHQVFSFNQVTGDRTEKEGYRVAPVIQAGELIDGLAGGMCQIASTLHAASWFAGLDILESTPHSRPSAYITMGLDSTVVYPTVDLKVRNPYDFPVIIHYRVNQGFVRAEVLGKPRKGKVAFERQILGQIAFARETRTDPTMPSGQRFLDQEGHNGYRIRRRRVFFQDRADRPTAPPQERIVAYPPTAQIERVGTGDAKLPKKVVPPSHHIANPEKPNAKDGVFRITR